jgi:hypothetical protein
MGGETESAGQKARPVFNRLGGRRKAKGAIFGRKPRLTPRQQRDAINRRDMDEAVFAPARRSRRMLLAYSCVKFACFICPSRWRPDSNSAWSKMVPSRDVLELADASSGDMRLSDHAARSMI